MGKCNMDLSLQRTWLMVCLVFFLLIFICMFCQTHSQRCDWIFCEQTSFDRRVNKTSWFSIIKWASGDTDIHYFVTTGEQTVGFIVFVLQL